MRKRLWLAASSLTLVLTLFAGCVQGNSEDPIVEVPLAFTPTIELDLSIVIPTFTLTPSVVDPSDSDIPLVTSTEIPSPELLPSPTHLGEPPGIDQEPTFTPDSNLVCPSVVSDLDLDIPIADTGLFMKVEVVLDYLNKGGSPERAIRAITDSRQGRIEWMDLTSDGVPELVLHLFYFMVYQCEQGQYLEVFRVSPMDLMVPPKAEIRDLNANGIPELVVSTMFLGAHDGTLSMHVYEWEGQDFVNRLPEKIDHPYGDRAVAYVEHGSVHMYNGSIRYADIDNNGTIEILVGGGGDGFYEDTVWMWNGEIFELHEVSH